MRKLISFSEANRVDRISQEHYKIPSIILMERAGVSCAKTLLPHLCEGAHILVICGSGNNGGDGFVVAREIHEKGFRVSIGMTRIAKTHDALIQYHIAHSLKIPIFELYDTMNLISHMQCTDWIVDAITGIGLMTPYKNQDLLRHINESNARVLSIDVPTGMLECHNTEGNSIDSEYNIVQADITVTMGLEKSAMYIATQRECCGTIIIAEEIFPTSVIAQSDAEAWLMEEEDISSLLPLAPLHCHKYSRGSLVIAAGSEQSPGAAILATRAASQGPSGIIHTIVDKAIEPQLIAHVPSIVSGRALEDIKKIHAVIVGPGWGNSIEGDINSRATLLRTLLEKNVPTVLDADALYIVPQKQYNLTHMLMHQPVIFTPHIRELEILAQPILSTDSHTSHWWTLAQEVARYYNAVVCAKNSVSYIVSPHSIPLVIDGSNPLLATGGSGDVLAGIIGSTLAYLYTQIYAPHPIGTRTMREGLSHIYTEADTMAQCLLEATVIGTLIHKKAGDILFHLQRNGDASDIIAHIAQSYAIYNPNLQGINKY